MMHDYVERVSSATHGDGVSSEDVARWKEKDKARLVAMLKDSDPRQQPDRETLGDHLASLEQRTSSLIDRIGVLTKILEPVLRSEPDDATAGIQGLRGHDVGRSPVDRCVIDIADRLAQADGLLADISARLTL